MGVLEFIGAFAIGVFTYQLLDRFVFPVLDILVGRKSNAFTKESTELQQEIYDIQSGAG